MLKYLAGLKPPGAVASAWSMRLLTAVVCVRSTFFSASERFHCGVVGVGWVHCGWVARAPPPAG